MSQSRVDETKVRYKYFVDSPDKCADLCLDKKAMNSLTEDENFKCRSYDFCAEQNSQNSFYCSFYDSTVTDQSVVVQSASACDHYSS